MGGTGGEFGNIIIVNNGNAGVKQNGCASEARTQTLPAARFYQSENNVDYLWWSPNNIIEGPGNFFDLELGCEGFTDAINIDPPPDDGFFDTKVMFKGAFGDDDLWIENWSWLDANGYLATYKSPVTVKKELSDDAKMGIIIGVAGAVVLIVLFSFYFYRRGRMYKLVSEGAE